MTARKHTHHRDDNLSDAEEDDVQQIINLFRQRSGSATVDYLRDLSEFPELQLRACQDELRNAGKIDVHNGVDSVRITLREQNGSNRPIVTDGSGLVRDLDLSIKAGDVFELLSSPRRREMLKQMAEITPPGGEDDTHIELRKLATMIATSKAGCRPADLDHRERHRAYVSLCQVHAEALDEYGVSTYHRRVKKITSTADVLALAEIVDAVEAAASAGSH